MRLILTVLFSLLFSFSISAQAQVSIETQVKPSPNIFKYSIYSESLYEARNHGATNESRLRLHYTNTKSWLDPYFGVVYSKDFTNGRTPLLTENMVAPVLGAQIKPYSFLSFFGEARQLYRIDNDNRRDSESELRYGAYVYYLHSFSKNIFNETYAEIVSINRISSEPVGLIWNKLGLRFQPNHYFQPDFFIEAFNRSSPDPGYGLSENELRLGTRMTVRKEYWALSFIVNYAPVSDVQVNSTDGLLVISREHF